jgi:hypothetical protein
MEDSTVKKLEWTDEEIMDYAVQLFLDSLPSSDEMRKLGENHGREGFQNSDGVADGVYERRGIENPEN